MNVQENTLFGQIAPEDRSNEWYTPARYVEAARAVMGGIDLDPASSEVANRTIKAKRFYTKEQNGLTYPWSGRLWLNPPYGRTQGYGSNIKLFTERLIHDYLKGQVHQAVLLTSGKVDASWFQLLWDYPICFTDHHVRFIRNYDTAGMPGRYTEGHMHGTVFVYLGPHIQQFIAIFNQFGPVVTPDSVHRRPAQALPPLLIDMEAIV